MECRQSTDEEIGFQAENLRRFAGRRKEGPDVSTAKSLELTQKVLDRSLIKFSGVKSSLKTKYHHTRNKILLQMKLIKNHVLYLVNIWKTNSLIPIFSREAGCKYFTFACQRDESNYHEIYLLA